MTESKVQLRYESDLVSLHFALDDLSDDRRRLIFERVGDLISLVDGTGDGPGVALLRAYKCGMKRLLERREPYDDLQEEAELRLMISGNAEESSELSGRMARLQERLQKRIDAEKGA